MKHYIKAIASLYTLFFFSALIQSCCNRDVYITEHGNMSTWDISGRNSISVIDGPFQLSVHFGERYAGISNVSLVSSAMATSCKEEYKNSILKPGQQLSLDKPFVFNGDTVAAGENLLDLPDSGIQQSGIVNNLVQFVFSATFIEKADMEGGRYLFRYSGKTSDGLQPASEFEIDVAIE